MLYSGAVCYREHHVSSNIPPGLEDLGLVRAASLKRIHLTSNVSRKHITMTTRKADPSCIISLQAEGIWQILCIVYVLYK